MIVTIVSMYRKKDAEQFVSCVRGTLNEEQREDWRRAFECDDRFEDDEKAGGEMSFRAMVLLNDQFPPGHLEGADGEGSVENPLANLRSVTVDCEDFQATNSDDNNGTTYYGGEIHVSDTGGVDIIIECKGNDRGDDECFHPTMEAVCSALGLSLEWGEECDDLRDRFWQHTQDGETYVVGVDDDRLVFFDGKNLTSVAIPATKE
jgi:hypothetical protein